MGLATESNGNDHSLKTLNGEKYANVNWDELGFGLVETDYMYIMKCTEYESFSQGTVTRYGNFEISPAAGIINYAQGLFEGLKAYRREDGKVLLFRPEQNALRMKSGAERMCLTSPSVDQFVEAVKQTVLANKHWVPPPGKGTLYVRPLLFGSGARLGLGPAPESTFLLYASPVGITYHKGLFNLIIEDKVRRATPGGTGGVKSVANYSPVFKVVTEAKATEFSDVLFLDAATGKNIEEVASCNIFIVKGNVISTPEISGTILAGVTRKSVIEIAVDLGYQVEERNIPLDDLFEADEVFCTGTAVVLISVDSVTYQGKRIEYNKPKAGAASLKLHSILTGIQTGRIEDKKGWTVLVD